MTEVKLASRAAVAISQRRKKIRAELGTLTDAQLAARFRELAKEVVDGMPKNRNTLIASMLVILEPTEKQKPARRRAAARR